MELSPYTSALLELLGQEEESQRLEIGGGVALWRYLPYRFTNVLDAWWEDVDENVRACIDRSCRRLAQQRGLEYSHKGKGGYESWDFRDKEQKVFAFQLAVKSRRVESPIASEWGFLRTESLRENMANKMCALVTRGAPRDLRDVARVLSAGLLARDELWELWQLRTGRHNDSELKEARRQVLGHLSALEGRRPLEGIEDQAARADAEQTRRLIRKFSDEA